MPIDVKMPQLGESVTEGTIGRWLKHPGDAVEEFEPLLEVTTDKVDTEVPSQLSGKLVEILVPEGETVRVGTVIARLAAANEATDGTVSGPPSAVGQAPQAVPEPAKAATGAPPISPVVAKLVAEHQINLAAIQGTGTGGRVTKKDVQGFLERRGNTPPTPEPAPAAPSARVEATAEALEAEATLDPHAVSEPRAQPTPALPAPIMPPRDLVPLATQATGAVLPPAMPQGGTDHEVVPLSPMRRSIAQHMVYSKQTAPHVTTVMEVDLSAITAHRASHRADYERQGARLTFTPYFVHATVAALREVPVLNGSFGDGAIVLHRQINIGVAVAIPDGLIVPVIKDADDKSLLGLARAVNDLSERARLRRLQPDETRGGTFTITNHGVSGSLFATPIINQPQVGILGVGAITKRVVVVSNSGTDALAIRSMCYLSLTFDHRVADGATADGFLSAIKQALERFTG